LEEAEKSLAEVSKRVRRVCQLEELVRAEFPKCHAPRVSAQFLQRVARCFIAGFETECVILCRSAIDVAFRDAVSDELVQQQSQRRYITLRLRADAACPDIIDTATLQAAVRVIERGNKAVHYEPLLQVNVIDTIRDALHVIDKLGSRPNGEG
jgi:hypothetical protein